MNAVAKRISWLAIVACLAGVAACDSSDEDDADASDGSGSPDASNGDGDGDGDQDDGGVGDGDGDGDCEMIPGQPYTTLSCAGLYTDIEAKELVAEAREFKPAYALWSDGADKTRWILLPEGEQIDNSDPDNWILPVGTKMFKEFKWNGHRVETRLFWKVADGRWLKTSYHWNEDETEATRFAGGEVDVAGDSYYIPAAKECDQCHKGRTDRALGFEMVSLALEGAEGITLQDLVDDDLLTDPPSDTSYELGDDGTGKAAAAMGYLHVNCGVSCHNGNPAAEAYSSDLRMRLPIEALNGGSPEDFDTVQTTVDVGAQTPRWIGQKRIVPGSPEDSLLYKLINNRDPLNPKDQMPPIGSAVIDEDGIVAIEEWILALPTP